MSYLRFVVASVSFTMIFYGTLRAMKAGHDEFPSAVKQANFFRYMRQMCGAGLPRMLPWAVGGFIVGWISDFIT